jgi:UDP-glucose 4-epimerase
MNILVTGTSGFIANKLVKELRNCNFNVICLDKDNDIDSSALVYDISSKNFVNEFPNLQVDFIFHLAAQSGGYLSLIDPYIDAKWNTVGTANMASLAKKLKVKKFIYISSMAVYGNAIKAQEFSTLPNPISFYGVSKYAGELQAKLLYEHNSIPYTVFRLFATYGSGQDLNNSHQGILSIYLNQMLNNSTVKITGKQDRVRELIHVDDVVKALMLGLQSNTDNEIYNVSNNELVTPRFIIEEISKQLNKEVQIIELEGYEGDQTYITSSTDKLSKLGWEPRISLKDGVKEFLNNI